MCDKARDLVSVISNKLVLIEEKRTSWRKIKPIKPWNILLKKMK